jgi:hypothetical protein
MTASHRSAARFGLAAKGALYAVLALLALRIANGDGAQADSQGAIRALAGRPFGSILVGLLALGLLFYAGWQAYAAWTGDDTKARVSAAVRSVIYAGLAFSAGRFLFEAGGGSRNQDESFTARLLDMPFGTWLVGAIGIGIVVVAISFLRRVIDHRYFDALKPMPARTARAVKIVTVTGIVARAGVYALAGAFLVRAALRHEPRSGVGLDGALTKVSKEPYGAYVLAAVAVGLLAYAVWCWVRVRFEDIERSDG